MAEINKPDVHPSSRKNQPGAGRKVGSGRFGEPTTVVRIPASQTPVVKDFLAAYQRNKQLSGLDTVTEFALPALNLQPIKLPCIPPKFPPVYPVRPKSMWRNVLIPARF